MYGCPVSPGIGHQFRDHLIRQRREADPDGDQPLAVPALSAGLRPFGDGLPDPLLTGHQADSVFIQPAGESRPTPDAEGGAAAVVILLSAREAEREFPHLCGVHAHTLPPVGRRTQSPRWAQVHTCGPRPSFWAVLA